MAGNGRSCRFPFFILKIILTIDIGNSSTKFAFFDGEEIVDRRRIPTNRSSGPEEILDELNDFDRRTIAGIAIASVVRELRDTYQSLAAKHLDAPVVFFDHTADLAFSVKYEPPEACGPDRLVAAHAAVIKYGAPAIVCDFGTATTIDLVNKKHEYMGGVIAPGIKTMADSLFEKTSRLPKVGVGAAQRVVGNSTERSIRSGIYFGYLGLSDGIISRMQQQIEGPVHVIATGGDAKLIAGESEFIEDVEPDLIHLGLSDLWERSQK